MYGDIPLNNSIFRDRNRYQVIADILDERGLNMVVTPKQIDEDVKNIAYIIGSSINEAVHEESFYL